MAPEPASGVCSGSPESSGRDSSIPRRWRNQLSQEEQPNKDKTYRKLASGVEKTLALFETALEEWADYISFLNKLLKALQARPASITTVPSKATVAKRLSQCLNPALPSGVHQKALEVYSYVFTMIGRDGLSRDLALYLPGLAPTLSFASLSVRAPFLDLLEVHFLEVDSRSLRPAIKSIILALLPGLEDETNEDFDRTLNLVTSFKKAVRPSNSQQLSNIHASGDEFFWQCFFLASITGHSRRSGALAYLVRYLPNFGPVSPATNRDPEAAPLQSHINRIALVVTSPEPGLLVRCIVSGLNDEHLLIQRGFLDLLVSHLPLSSSVLQSRVKPADLELLVYAAAGVVTRKDMSLNRRLWAWLLGPDPIGNERDQGGEPSEPSPKPQQSPMSSKTNYFEDYGIQPLVKVLLDMIRGNVKGNAAERVRPFKICLSLMDRWEIGGLIVPEVLLPIFESVRQFQNLALGKAEFAEVLRSASFFIDGIESGLIYSELFRLLTQALGAESLGMADRTEKMSLVGFIIANFNVRKEEMMTIHAPLTCLIILCMLKTLRDGRKTADLNENELNRLSEQALKIVASLIEMVPDRAFPATEARVATMASRSDTTQSTSHSDIVQKIEKFYLHQQGNIDSCALPFSAVDSGELLLENAADYIYDGSDSGLNTDLGVRVHIFVLILLKTPTRYAFSVDKSMRHLKKQLSRDCHLPFSYFSAALQLATQLYATERIQAVQLSELVAPLVQHAWSYLSASDPKFHVETVRCLWQLQTALLPGSREIEAALSSILVERQSEYRDSLRFAEAARTFGVLWSHTLQDSAADRRSAKMPTQEYRSSPRLSGMDHYQVMLTQPLFLVLDALLDEQTPPYMVVKYWLNSMIGIDRLFLLLVAKLSELPFMSSLGTKKNTEARAVADKAALGEEDDVDLCLYYLRTLHNVLRCTGDVYGGLLASRYIEFSSGLVQIRGSPEEGEMTLQEYFIRVCVECVTREAAPDASELLVGRISLLCRYALTVLDQFLSSQHAAPAGQLRLDGVLFDKLTRSISAPDPYAQVLLLDVIHGILRLQQVASGERPTSAPSEKIPRSTEPARAGRVSPSPNDGTSAGSTMPSQLLNCLQAGLSSISSHTFLDCWVSFLSGCLPLYAHAIFQVLTPLVETLCTQIKATLSNLQSTFQVGFAPACDGARVSESALFCLLNGLERVLAVAHDQLTRKESQVRLLRGPEQPQSLFGSMVSGVFQSDSAKSRSATANDRLTVQLAFQDTLRTCYQIWSWGQGDETKRQDPESLASFNHTSLRMKNWARRLLEHLFAAETLECLETVIDIWSFVEDIAERDLIFSFLSALDACRPRHCVPALFNSIYSRTNPGALDPSRKSAMTIPLRESNLVVFLIEYARSLEDDAMDEIWQDCMTFIRELLGNPFPHRHTLPSLLEFAAILGEKVDNTNFGEQQRMRRELGDLFLRLLAALFTTHPMTFPESNGSAERLGKDGGTGRRSTVASNDADGSDDVVSVLASIVPMLPKILLENDRVLSAAASISTNVLGPALRSRAFPDTLSPKVMRLLRELSRLPNNQKAWKKDVGEAFNDRRFFGTRLELVMGDWLPLLRQWVLSDKDKMAEIIGRISAPTTAGIVFGVGATSARLEADRRTQLNLRRMATLVLAAADDAFVPDLGAIFGKLVELLAATATSSPSSTTQADVFLVVRALVLRISPVHLAMLWPVVSAEMHVVMASAVAPDHSPAAERYGVAAVLQACKLLDLAICVAPDDFQLHEWLFVTDTVDAVYRPATYQPVALVDELAEEVSTGGDGSNSRSRSSSSSGGGGGVKTSIAAVDKGTDSHGDQAVTKTDSVTHTATGRSLRRPLLARGTGSGMVIDDADADNAAIATRAHLVTKVLRPFFAQLSIFAFEATYAMSALDADACLRDLLADLFDERTMVRAL